MSELDKAIEVLKEIKDTMEDKLYRDIKEHSNKCYLITNINPEKISAIDKAIHMVSTIEQLRDKIIKDIKFIESKIKEFENSNIRNGKTYLSNLRVALKCKKEDLKEME